MIKRLLLTLALLAFAGSAFAQGPGGGGSPNLNIPGGNQQNLNANQVQYFQESYTPVITGLTTAGSMNYTTQVGSYEVNGRLATVRFHIGAITTPTTTPEGALSVSLPTAATATSTAEDYGSCQVALYSGVQMDTNFTQLSGTVAPGAVIAYLYENGSSQVPTRLDGLNNVTSPITAFELIGVCNYRM